MLKQTIRFVNLQLGSFNSLIWAEEIFNVVNTILELLVTIEFVLHCIVELIKVQFELRNYIPFPKAVGSAADNIVDSLQDLVVRVARFRSS